MVSPAATPIRRSPKSKARMTRACASGMTGDEADPRAVDAQQLPRGLPAIFEWQFKHNAGVDRQADPGVIEHLLLELARVPGGISQGNERIGRTVAAGDRRQHVARGRHLYVVGNLVRGVTGAA